MMDFVFFIGSQTVEIKVKMDCDGCERKVKNAITSIKGSLSLSLSELVKSKLVATFVIC